MNYDDQWQILELSNKDVVVVIMQWMQVCVALTHWYVVPLYQYLIQMLAYNGAGGKHGNGVMNTSAFDFRELRRNTYVWDRYVNFKTEYDEIGKNHSLFGNPFRSVPR